MELHPYLQQKDFVKYHATKGIHVTQYSPFGNSNPIYSKGENMGKLIDDPVLAAVGKKHGKTGAGPHRHPQEQDRVAHKGEPGGRLQVERRGHGQDCCRGQEVEVQRPVGKLSLEVSFFLECIFVKIREKGFRSLRE